MTAITSHLTVDGRPESNKPITGGNQMDDKEKELTDKVQELREALRKCRDQLSECDSLLQTYIPHTESLFCRIEDIIIKASNLLK